MLAPVHHPEQHYVALVSIWLIFLVFYVMMVADGFLAEPVKGTPELERISGSGGVQTVNSPQNALVCGNACSARSSEKMKSV